MIDKTTAKNILHDSIESFVDQNGVINAANLEAEVINNTCLYILGNQRKKGLQQNSIQDMFLSILKDAQENNSVEVTRVFTEAALEVFHKHYTAAMAINATLAVQQNIGWDGMWEFLKKYYIKNHKIDIDEIYS